MNIPCYIIEHGEPGERTIARDTADFMLVFDNIRTALAYIDVTNIDPRSEKFIRPTIRPASLEVRGGG